MAFAGLLHLILNVGDIILSLWIVAVAFIAVGMFGFGYIIRDKLPERMDYKCKRFYFMGQEFGVWHWTRAQVFLADIFLVGLGGAVFGWGASHTIPLLVIGTPFDEMVPLLYVPIFYCYLWNELAIELFFVAMSIIGFVYETRTWLLGKNADFCHFNGIDTTSAGLTYDCDPEDIDCQLNTNLT
jgi:hypothetical protein